MKKETKSNTKIFNEIIYTSKHFIAAQDWEIAIPGFYIISPKRKVQSLLELSDKECVDYIKTIKKIRKAMLNLLNIKEVYYFQNEDSPYGFHLWMLPYHEWMEDVAGRGPGILVPVWKYAKKNMSTKKDIQKTKDAAEKMRRYFSKKTR